MYFLHEERRATGYSMTSLAKSTQFRRLHFSETGRFTEDFKFEELILVTIWVTDAVTACKTFHFLSSEFQRYL